MQRSLRSAKDLRDCGQSRIRSPLHPASGWGGGGHSVIAVPRACRGRALDPLPVRRSRRILSALGDVQLSRPWYLCPPCHQGQFPRAGRIASSPSSDEFRPAIPRRVGRHQSPSPLHRHDRLTMYFRMATPNRTFLLCLDTHRLGSRRTTCFGCRLATAFS